MAAAAAIGLLRTAAARPSLLRAGARMFASDRMQPWQAPSFTQSGTRKLFTEEHDQYREVAKRFFAEKVTPFHEKWEDAGIVSREVWQEAGKSGLVGVTVPEAYGGPGADILYAAVLWDEQAFSGMFGPGFSIHSEICLPYIMHYGSEAIKQKYLPKTVTGDCIVAIAMTEPGAGSDLQGIKTTAVREGDEYVINGSKTFISNGALSDTCIVVARTDPKASKAAHGISLIMVDTNTPGYTKGRKLKKLGLKAQDTSELFFDNVRVPVTNRLGEENKGFYYLMNELPQERLTIAGLAIAHAEACYEWTRTYVKERKAFGGTLSNLQTVRHKLAELKTMISVSRAFFDNCLELHVNGKLDTQTASMAKYWCTDVECKVADECLQLHGGWGYMWEFPISRAFADARVQKIYGGANEIMKELISRSI